MTESEILFEVERRIEDWFKTPGWSEENAGLNLVSDWIKALRADGEDVQK